MCLLTRQDSQVNVMLGPRFVTQIIIYYPQEKNWLLLEAKLCAIPANVFSFNDKYLHEKFTPTQMQ